MTTQPTTLGAFSVSLAVKNLKASRTLYEKLDFEVVLGDEAQNWLILRNGIVTIGLFQGAAQAQHVHVQSWLGRKGAGRRRVYRRARAPAPPQGERTQAYK